MNIEIANRLVNLRKENGLSQEQLAEKIGVSRQAVSKWERSEASPDTDNIILLARLYNISLDELLRTDDDIPRSETSTDADEPAADGFEQTEQTSEAEQEEETEQDVSHDGYYKESHNGDKVHIGLDGIHVIDHNGDNVHIGLKGIHVEENGGDSVHIGLGGIHVEENGGHRAHVSPAGVFVDDKEYSAEEWKNEYKRKIKFDTPIIILSILAFLGFGFVDWVGWSISWLFLLAIPILCSAETAIRRKNPTDFAFPILAALVFFSIGLSLKIWHPTWAVFISIPIYYLICEKIKGKAVGAAIIPVVISAIYLIFGLFFNLWHPTWIIFITIPLFYWIMGIFKRNKSE